MDILFSKSKLRIMAALGAGIGCVLMICYPSISLLSAQKGIYLWISSVLPALLPFFICASFMNSLGITRFLPTGMFTFLMSIMSGYPMGAKIIGEKVLSGEIDQNEAKKLISFCSTSGPTFMLGAIGIGMLGNVMAGAIIAICHYLGALINGLFFSFILNMFQPKKKTYTVLKKHNDKSIGSSNKDLLTIFTEAILSSLKSLGIILAYIVLFMFITDMVKYTGFFDITPLSPCNSILKGVLEMTVGCADISTTSASYSLKIIICTGLVSFGGLSIIGQSLSMLAGSGISPFYMLLCKLFHVIWAVLLALFICVILGL